MTNPKMETSIKKWEKEFRLKYVPDCGNDEVCRAFYDSMIDSIRQLLQEQRSEIVKGLNKAIAEEIIIATVHGEKTSRLTSLAMKISKIFENNKPINR